MTPSPNLHSWLDRSGVFHAVTGNHDGWLHRQRLTKEDAERQGLARVQFVGSTIYADLPQPLNHHQKQALISLAIETGFEQVAHETANGDHAIWLRQTRPESLALQVANMLLENDLTPEEFMGFIKDKWTCKPQSDIRPHTDRDGTIHYEAPYEFSQGGRVFGPRNSVKLRTYLTTDLAQKWCDYFNFVQSVMPYSPALYNSVDAWIDAANSAKVYEKWRQLESLAEQSVLMLLEVDEFPQVGRFVKSFYRKQRNFFRDQFPLTVDLGHGYRLEFQAVEVTTFDAVDLGAYIFTPETQKEMNPDRIQDNWWIRTDNIECVRQAQQELDAFVAYAKQAVHQVAHRPEVVVRSLNVAFRDAGHRIDARRQASMNESEVSPKELWNSMGKSYDIFSYFGVPEYTQCRRGSGTDLAASKTLNLPNDTVVHLTLSGRRDTGYYIRGDIATWQKTRSGENYAHHNLAYLRTIEVSLDDVEGRRATMKALEMIEHEAPILLGQYAWKDRLHNKKLLLDLKDLVDRAARMPNLLVTRRMNEDEEGPSPAEIVKASFANMKPHEYLAKDPDYPNSPTGHYKWKHSIIIRSKKKTILEFTVSVESKVTYVRCALVWYETPVITNHYIVFDKHFSASDYAGLFSLYSKVVRFTEEEWQTVQEFTNAAHRLRDQK